MRILFKSSNLNLYKRFKNVSSMYFKFRSIKLMEAESKRKVVTELNQLKKEYTDSILPLRADIDNYPIVAFHKFSYLLHSMLSKILKVESMHTTSELIDYIESLDSKNYALNKEVEAKENQLLSETNKEKFFLLKTELEKVIHEKNFYAVIEKNVVKNNLIVELRIFSDTLDEMEFSGEPIGKDDVRKMFSKSDQYMKMLTDISETKKLPKVSFFHRLFEKSKTPVDVKEKKVVAPAIEKIEEKKVEKNVIVKSAVKTTTKPVVKPTAKPVIKPTVKPVVKPIVKRVIKPTVKPVIKAISSVKHTVKTIVKPVVKEVKKPKIAVKKKLFIKKKVVIPKKHMVKKKIVPKPKIKKKKLSLPKIRKVISIKKKITPKAKKQVHVKVVKPKKVTSKPKRNILSLPKIKPKKKKTSYYQGVDDIDKIIAKYQ